jgi:hypothetical protein
LQPTETTSSGGAKDGAVKVTRKTQPVDHGAEWSISTATVSIPERFSSADLIVSLAAKSLSSDRLDHEKQAV